jgi:hypothetical protein
VPVPGTSAATPDPSEIQMAETRPTQAQQTDAQPAPTGNRPAAGAREVSGTQAIDLGWQGAQGATDFLGLEPEMRLPGPAPAPGADGATDSWLFEIERRGLDAPSAPLPSAAEPQTAPSAAAAPPPEPDAEPDALEPGVLEPSVETARTRRTGRHLLRLAALAAAIVAVAGAWVAWERFGPRHHPSEQVASTGPADARTPQRTPRTTPKAAVADTPAGTSTSAPQPAAPAPDSASAPVPPPVAASEPVPAPAEPAARAPAPAPAPAPTPPPATALSRAAAAPSDADVPLGRRGPGSGRPATAEDWSGIWTESTIPFDAIRGAQRLRTLNVGRVRAELTNGEFVEGTLYAVGESRVWLEVPLGRLAFEASSVHALAQVAGTTPAAAKGASQAFAGLTRVEVVLAGGSLTGRVLERTGDRVTLVTDDGLRLKVDALDVRPAPNGSSRLIGPVAKARP